jgi:hypothetical protein
MNCAKNRREETMRKHFLCTIEVYQAFKGTPRLFNFVCRWSRILRRAFFNRCEAIFF